MSETATNNKIYDKLTPQRKQLVDIILANLEKGVGLWKQGWLGGAPKSGITGKPYRGINRLFLSAATMEKGYSDNRWVTFNQMEDKGWSFKRNEEGESLGKGAGVAIEFYELRDKETKKPFDRRTLDGMTRAEQEEYMDENVYPILPEITVTNAEFWQNTNKSFTVNSSDNSGSCTLYYKVDDGSWKSCNGNSYTVSDYANDGRYYFYAKDAYGNMTQEKWVEFGAELNGEFVKSDTDNSVYFTWDRASWTATLDGKSYSKGTWIREEGEHTIKLSSKTKSAVYPYTINHYYIESMESPTCISGGYLQYDCIQCGDTYTNYSIEEMGHYYVASTIAPTCTTGGYTTYTCTRCGDAYKDNFTNAYGHNYESTFQPATCTEYGRTIFTCQLCGHSYNENDGTFPTGHNYTNTIITEPNCTSTGMRRSVCDTCGDTFDTVIAANGHSYSITDVKSKNGITTRTYHCSSCGHTYKQELGDQYEEVSNYVEYLFIQYSPYMWWVLLAAAGIWSIVIGVMIAIAHKNEDKEKARKMLINYVIGLVVIAVIVVACPFLIRGIAALVT